MVYPLHSSASATANAQGIATATIGPGRATERWYITRLTVSSNSTVLVPTARVYRAVVSTSTLIDGTHTGTLDHSDTNLKLQPGENILAQWTGADVNSVCTFVVEGESSTG
jgi:hypothetical protein